MVAETLEVRWDEAVRLVVELKRRLAMVLMDLCCWNAGAGKRKVKNGLDNEGFISPVSLPA